MVVLERSVPWLKLSRPKAELLPPLPEGRLDLEQVR